MKFDPSHRRAQSRDRRGLVHKCRRCGHQEESKRAFSKSLAPSRSDGKPPAAVYSASRRQYTGIVPPFEYPGHFILKRIANAGTFRFKKKLLFIANSLKQKIIGLEEVDDGIWSIYFCDVLLGRIDERTYIIRD